MEAYRIALSREPSQAEMEGNLRFLGKRALIDLCAVILNLNEFVYMN